MPKIHIHPLLMVFIMISIVTGTFINLLIMFVIVLWHELGHYMMARYFNWHIESVVLWVFGGVMKTDEHGTCRLYEDILVTMAGPLQHLFIYLVLLLCDYFNILSPTLLQLAFQYNVIILLFNLLPIYPLDGGKLLFYMMSLFAPFRKAYHFILIFSMCLSIVIIIVKLIYFPFTLSVLLIISFILLENRTEWKNRMFVFRRFLLRRLKKINYEKKIEKLVATEHDLLIHIFSQFKRERTYIIYVKQLNSMRKLHEYDCLTAFFYDKKLTRKISDLVIY